MKKTLKSLALALAFVVGVSSAYADPGPFAACETTTLVTSGGFIYKNSAPLRSGGVGTPLVGYRIEPTLIMLKSGVADKKSTKIYAANGTVIGTCPWATAHDAPGGRYRCTMNTRALVRKAVKTAKSSKVYIQLKSKTKTCVEVPHAGKCYGSVKGLCTQTMS